MNPIVITRIAVRSALGNSLKETVDALQRSESGIRTPMDLEQSPRINAGAGEVPLPPSDRGAWRAELLLRRTLGDLLSQHDRDSISNHPSRWAAVIGTTLAGMRHCGVGMRADEASSLSDADIAYARTCASSVLAHAFRECGIEGPTVTVSCACASALSAVNHACSLLASGEVDAVVAGGYDPISEFVYGGFAALQLVAGTALSPFARDREGMKLGEGAALFVLRRASDLSSAERAAALGSIVGFGESSDAHHLTQPHPQGNGAARALLAALDGAHETTLSEAKLPDLLVAHATGTPGNDGAEHAAYRTVFGAKLHQVPVVALKSRFGHPLGAAGVLEVSAVIGCAQAGFIPATAGRGRDRDAFPELDLVEGNTRAARPHDIVVLSAGFGGANAATRIVREVPSVAANTSDGSCAVLSRSNTAIAVTAVGAVSPAGRGIDALIARTSDPARWEPLSEDILAPLLDRAKARRLALLPRLMIAAVRDLTDRASLTSDELASTPLLAANWCGAADFTERYYRDLLRAGIDLANPMLFAESVPNIGSAQCSLAFGITAPSLSVIGRRTAGLEALFLTMARINQGLWRRAIIVAAEEEHPIVARTLSRCTTRDVPLRSASIAFLLEGVQGRHTPGQRPLFTIEEITGRTTPLNPEKASAAIAHSMRSAMEQTEFTTSSTPFDDPIAAALPRCRRIHLAEFGAATAFATILADLPHGSRVISCADPHGACWAARIRNAPSV